MTNTPPTGTTTTATTTTAAAQDPTVLATSTDAITANNVAQTNQGLLLQQNALYMTTISNNMTTATAVLKLLGDGLSKGTQAFSDLNSSVSAYMEELNSSADQTSASMNKMGLAITAVVGASEPFRNWQADGLTTFSSQINDLVDVSGKSLSVLQNLANSMGLKVPAAFQKSAEALGGFIKSTATAADYSLKTEDVYIKMAARTGELGDKYIDLSSNTEHMNAMVADQISQFTQASKATNISIDDAQKYYVALKAIPGAMKEMNEADAHAAGGVSDLTKTIQLARGTGRDYVDVVNDMHEAVRNYNASIPEAMRFTEQISEISKNYHVELDDVRKSLTATSEALKMFGNEGDGAAAILNEYVGSLKATGLSGAVATDIVGNMTRQLGQLTIAQKAFLSAQSGGAGGLQGSFQIDNLLRQKDGLQKVFEMTKNQMTKMMGTLVSVKEAAENPQAAAQMTKQIMMLRQGPLGQFARTDQEAERIIEAFKSGRSSDFKELAKGQEGVDSAAKTGNDLAQQSNTYLKSIRDLIAEARGEAATAMIDMFQTGTTAGAGKEMDTQNNEMINDQKAFLRENMQSGATASAGPASSIRVVNDIAKTLADAPTAVKAAWQGFSQSLTEEGKQEREMKYADFMKEQESRKREASTLPVASRQKELSEIDKNERSMKDLISSVGQQQPTPAPTQEDLMKPQTSGLGVPLLNSPGQQVADAANTNANRKTTSTGSPEGMPAHPMAAPRTTSRNELGEITVHVEGYCLDCGEKMKGQTQRAAVSPATK